MIRKINFLIIFIGLNLFNLSYSANIKIVASVDGKIITNFDLIKEYNYLELLTLFPENTKEGHGTEALPIIWEEKDKFDALMKKSSDQMIKLASIIEDQDDFRAALKQYMWSSCKACHSRYRAPH